MRTPRLLAAALTAAVAAVPLCALAAPAAVAAPERMTARHLLDLLPVRGETHAGTYERSRFDLWIDADHDGLSTRAEVLKAESTTPVTVNAAGTVKTGRWESPYDGKVVTVASKLDIDHLVPLEQAWVSGAASWSATRRTAYANDLGYGPSLIAVTLHENRSKGDDEPAAYVPPRAADRCAYVKQWIGVKYRWRLSVDAAERTDLARDLASWCGASPRLVLPVRPSSGQVRALASTTAPAKHRPAPKPKPKPPARHGLDPRYATCTELLRHPNHAPYVRGVDPEYAWYQDRDGDGRVCE